MSSQASTPAAKRRRIDAANATLRAPFRSPLLNRPKTTETVRTSASPTSTNSELDQTSATVQFESSSSVLPATPVSAAAARLREMKSYKPVRSSSLSKPVAPVTLAASAQENTPSRMSSRKIPTTDSGSRALPGKKKGLDQDPLFEQLRLAQKAVDSATRATKAELDVVKQAATLEKESQAKRPGEPVDAELRELVVKWKGASRMAAEEVFEIVKGRVQAAGGVKAWKEMQNRGRGFFDDEPGSKARSAVQGEEGGSGGDDDESHVNENDREVQKAGDSPSTVEEESEFTMLMMLQSLNIEPDLLGYDPIEDRWQD